MRHGMNKLWNQTLQTELLVHAKTIKNKNDATE